MSPLIMMPRLLRTYDDEVLSDNPYAYYKLDETVGPTLTDSSGNGLDGTYSGSPTYGVTGLVSDGGDAIDISPVAHPNMQGAKNNDGLVWTDDYTVEAWINYDSAAPTDSLTIVEQFPQFGLGGFLWYVQNTFGANQAHLRVNIRKTAGEVIVEGATNLLADTTYHVVMRLDYPTVTFWINGVEDTYGITEDLTETSYQDATFNIGYTRWAAATQILPFDGTIDNVAFYDSALSDARILAHYNAGA